MPLRHSIGLGFGLERIRARGIVLPPEGLVPRTTAKCAMNGSQHFRVAEIRECVEMVL